MLGPIFKVTPSVEEKTYGKYIIEPLDLGYGHTLGNSLRRILLGSLPGAAIVSVRISGVKHQFSTLPGLKEDIVELILNLKKIKIKFSGEDEVKITLSVNGPRDILAKDFETPPEVEIVNKDQYLGTLADKKSKLELEAVVKKGFGYTPAEEQNVEGLGVIPLDALFTPVIRVNYKIEATRVGRMTNLDKLIMEIWTDGTILPYDALKDSAKNLVSYFTQVFEPKIYEEDVSLKVKEGDIDSNVLKLTIEELDLPTRIANCLKNAGKETVKDLIEAQKIDLVHIKNLGAKSLTLIEEKLKEKGLSIKE